MLVPASVYNIVNIMFKTVRPAVAWGSDSLLYLCDCSTEVIHESLSALSFYVLQQLQLVTFLAFMSKVCNSFLTS